MSENDSKITRSAISQGTLEVRDGGGLEISRDTEFAHTALQRADVQELVERQQLATTFVSVALDVAHDIYEYRRAGYDQQINDKLAQARAAETEGDHEPA